MERTFPMEISFWQQFKIRFLVWLAESRKRAGRWRSQALRGGSSVCTGRSVGDGKIENLEIKILKLLVLFWLASFLLGASPVGAVETVKLAIYPASSDEKDVRTKSWFIFNQQGGKRESREVVVQNKSEIQTVVDLYAVDATANADGAFTLFPRGTRDDVGGWVELSQNELVLAPGEKRTVPFVLNVPVSASPGDHVGGLAIEPREEASLSTSGVKVKQRLGVRLYVNVAGEAVEGLEIKDLRVVREGGDRYLLYTLVNRGNTNLQLSSQVKLASVLGQAVVNLDKMPEILAGREIAGKMKLEAVKPLSFSATLDLAFGRSGRVSKTALFGLTPFAWALASLLLLPPVLLILFKKRKKA